MSILGALTALIREEGPAIFASPEDADYFRKTFSKQLKKTPSRETLSSEIKKTPLSPPPQSETKNLSPPPVTQSETKKLTPPQTIIPKIQRSEPSLPALKPMEPKPVVNFSSLRNLLSIVEPQLAILDEIPNDTIARKLSERWKTKNQTAPISILAYQEPKEQRALLDGIAKALDICFGPAKIVEAEKIEKEKQWEAFLSVADLKVVIACDYTLWQLSSLMTFYKEMPAQGSRLLKNTPLFLLPDLSLYLKDASLKRSLWKALCQKCT